MSVVRATIVVVVVALAGAATNACSNVDQEDGSNSADTTVSSLPPAGPGSNQPPSKAQRAAFTDQKVTFEEYEQAIFRMRDCIVESGGSLGGPTLGPDLTYQYSWADSIETSGLGPKCYGKELGSIDMAWQTGPEVAEKRKPENEQELRNLQKCLGAIIGKTVTETDRNVLHQQIAENGGNPAKCLLDP